MANKTIGIDGMSCGHCANWITESLSSLEGVSSVEVSLSAKNAIIECDDNTNDDAIREAVEKAGYSVTSID